MVLIAVGEKGASTTGMNNGAVHLYEREGDAWRLQASLAPPDGKFHKVGCFSVNAFTCENILWYVPRLEKLNFLQVCTSSSVVGATGSTIQRLRGLAHIANSMTFNGSSIFVSHEDYDAGLGLGIVLRNTRVEMSLGLAQFH